MSLSGYVFTLGAAFVTLVLTGLCTAFIIRLDEPKRGKTKSPDA